MVTPTRVVKLRTGKAELDRIQDNIAAVAEPVAQALQRTPIMGAPPPAWQPFTLATGFANTNSPFVPGGRAVASYHVDALGYVHAQGAITCAAGCIAGTALLPAASPLPMGTRPLGVIRLACPTTPGAQSIQISPTGVVTAVFAIGAGGEIEISCTWLGEQ